MNSKNSQSGFTIVEVIVTMIVTTVFLVAFVQAYLVLESQRLLVGQRAKAGDIAYTNLRKFTVRPSNLTCDSATMDISGAGSSSKPGKSLGDERNAPPAMSSLYGFRPEDTSGTNSLGQGVRQSVVAFAPQGCANFATNPVKIVSTVTYGNNETVTHAAFVN